MPGSPGGVLTEQRFEQLFLRALEVNRPFHESMLKQMSAIETRLEAMNQDQHEVKTAMEVLTSHEFKRKIEDLDTRTRKLESEQSQRVGALAAVNWAPKVMGWLTVLVAVILFYLQSQRHT